MGTCRTHSHCDFKTVECDCVAVEPVHTDEHYYDEDECIKCLIYPYDTPKNWKAKFLKLTETPQMSRFVRRFKGYPERYPRHDKDIFNLIRVGMNGVSMKARAIIAVRYGCDVLEIVMDLHKELQHNK